MFHGGGRPSLTRRASLADMYNLSVDRMTSEKIMCGFKVMSTKKRKNRSSPCNAVGIDCLYYSICSGDTSMWLVSEI